MIPNMWYPICRPQDVPRREPVGLRRLGEDLVLFRDAAGRVVCMLDRCAHKGAKLSARLPGISRLSKNVPAPGRIACPYHGFEYDSSGACVAIPALGENARIPKGMCVKTYKVADEYGLIWLWYGDDRREEELPEIPMFEQFRRLGISSAASGYIPREGSAPVHYTRWMESTTEFYHGPFVHWGTWLHYLMQYNLRAKFVHDFKFEAHGHHLKSVCVGKHEHDRYPQGLERFLPWKRAWGFSVEVLLPTLVLIDVPPFVGLVIPIPVDEDHTIALHAAVFRPAFLQKLPAAIAERLGYLGGVPAILFDVFFEQPRDIELMETQVPKVSDVGVNRLIEPDAIGSRWMSLRKQLKEAAVTARLTRTRSSAQAPTSQPA